MAKDLELEGRPYEERIAAYGGVELFLGGMGVDGHIAFNEPGLSPGKVPSTALSVEVATITDAREVLIIVDGCKKARVLRASVKEISQMWTLSCLQMHPKAIIVYDKAATDELKVGTVRHFKDIEKFETSLTLKGQAGSLGEIIQGDI
jgi:glucosamine-6-phosphate deaminase